MSSPPAWSRSSRSISRHRTFSGISSNGRGSRRQRRYPFSESSREDIESPRLSNANELHTPLHRRRFSAVIETFYFSDEIGAVKPDRAIFDHVIRDLDVTPDRIAFFDDTPVNVEAAQNAGINAFAVDGLDELKNLLHHLGLLATSA